MARGDDEAAGGASAVLETAKHALRAGVMRTLPALRVVNQPDGFDCPGCAWPEAQEHGLIEFCENGAKAVAHEATQRHVTRELFLTHTVPALRHRTHRELESYGRLLPEERSHLDDARWLFDYVQWLWYRSRFPDPVGDEAWYAERLAQRLLRCNN